MADTTRDRVGNFNRKGLSNSDDLSRDSEKRKYGGSSSEEDIDGSPLDDTSPKKQKVVMGFKKSLVSFKPAALSEKKGAAPITIKLGPQKLKDTVTALQHTSASVASVFNQDSDEEEEMPPEARMRMRNIGRDTPTSAGPNSFGKTRQGFCDAKKVFERQLKEKMEEVSDK